MATPQLRVAVTPHCNLHCFYCRPEGEGWAQNPRDILEREDIAFLVDLAARVGFTHVKFTGGEPLLRVDLAEIVSDTARCPGIQEVQLVTNGTLLERRAQSLRDAGLSILTLSLDAATQESFRVIRGGDLSAVLAGLDAAVRVGLPIRINMVVTRRNLKEISGVMGIARKCGASLKLLDLINLTAPSGDDEWLVDFVPFTEVRDFLAALGAVFVGLEPAPGGIGAPLLDYRLPDGLQVVLNDSLYGGYYNNICRTCSKHPCQDALISLRVTHDGHLKKCLIRDDNLVPVGHLARARDELGLRQHLMRLFQDIGSSRFFPDAWRPPARTQVHTGNP